jgi:hypothetical protein
MSTEDTPQAEVTGTEAALGAPLAGTDDSTTKLNPSEPVHFELLTRLGQLEEALLARDPLMKTHLGAIHKQLITHEELVHLLSPVEIGKIVAAQQAHTNTSLAQEVTTTSGKAKAAKRAAQLGLGDL